MDREEAEQLAKRIQNEAPYLILRVEPVTSLGDEIRGERWSIRVTARATRFFWGR